MPPAVSTTVLPANTEADQCLEHYRLADDPGARIGIVRCLAAIGPDATQPLCEILKDRDVGVRLAAVEALAQVGDGRGVQPLLDQLRLQQKNWSARVQRWHGNAICVAAAYAIWVLAVDRELRTLFQSALLVGFVWLSRKREPGYAQAVTHAIGRIAERHPSPLLNGTAAELRILASDRVWNDKPHREMQLEVALRLEQIAGQLKDLPLASGAPAADPRRLPVASDIPSSSTESVVRITSA